MADITLYAWPDKDYSLSDMCQQEIDYPAFLEIYILTASLKGEKSKYLTPLKFIFHQHYAITPSK